ncbi:MAG: hypothetical protein AAGC88_10700, partial [Bacteroidota bacterium]
MKRRIDTITIAELDEVPEIETIRSISRERILRLVFESTVEDYKDKAGERLKRSLVGFQIGVHTLEPEIRITKLISDSQIENHQNFFEKCALEYRQLGKELLYDLIERLDLELNKDFPLETFNKLKKNRSQSGQLNEWSYYIHGFHCGFENNVTGQLIEVSLVFGQEFGDLDPYFFSRFI